jgi:hypothetical protein
LPPPSIPPTRLHVAADVLDLVSVHLQVLSTYTIPAGPLPLPSFSEPVIRWRSTMTRSGDVQHAEVHVLLGVHESARCPLVLEADFVKAVALMLELVLM